MKKSAVESDVKPANGDPASSKFSGGDTLSCVKCGVHKARKLGNFERKFGGRLFFCFECKPKKDK
jgi:hypothetical protein